MSKNNQGDALNATAHGGWNTLLGALGEWHLSPGMGELLPWGCRDQLALFSSVCSYLHFSELIFLVLLSTYYLPRPVLVLEIP